MNGSHSSDTARQVCGLVRRIRRNLDLSQRQLAEAIGTSSSTIARAESEGRIGVDLLCRLLALVDCRLAGVDESGTALVPMREDAPRDRGGRRYPAHLDAQFPPARTPELAAWLLRHGHGRHEPILTFRRRPRRDLNGRRIVQWNKTHHRQSNGWLVRTVRVEDDHPSQREFYYWRHPDRERFDALWAQQEVLRAEFRAQQAEQRRRYEADHPPPGHNAA